jgi:Plasmid pRiA4b ORF-3-like protein
MPGVHAPTVHQLKIGLEGAAPPLWRRIQVPSAASLGFLHSVIQETFGWEGFHLHRFRDERGREWGEPHDPDGGGYLAATFADEEEAGLGKVLRAEGAVLSYVYDFGDDWRHRIEVEKILPLDPGVTYPRCTGGRRAAPPSEDIGGIWGLEEISYLVTHPEANTPEQFEDLVSHLRDKGYDPDGIRSRGTDPQAVRPGRADGGQGHRGSSRRTGGASGHHAAAARRPGGTGTPGAAHR